MSTTDERHRACSCGAMRVWIGTTATRARVCLACDSPSAPKGWPQGFDPATWEINQRARERGEL